DPTTGGASGNEMDAALWQAQGADSGALTAGVRQVAVLPFDHTRRATTTLVDDPGAGQRMLITKGAPEQVLTRCAEVPASAHQTLDGLFAQGRRVVAVATKPASGLAAMTPSDECGLTLAGFLSFADNPKSAARDSLARLAELEIEVKVATGENP